MKEEHKQIIQDIRHSIIIRQISSDKLIAILDDELKEVIDNKEKLDILTQVIKIREIRYIDVNLLGRVDDFFDYANRKHRQISIKPPVAINEFVKYINHDKAKELSDEIEPIIKRAKGTEIGVWLLALQDMELITFTHRQNVYDSLRLNNSQIKGANNTINKHTLGNPDRTDQINAYKKSIQTIINKYTSVNNPDQTEPLIPE